MWLAAGLIAALGLHAVPFLTYFPGDVRAFVAPWYREILVNGLSEPVGNYSPPYLYLLWAATWFDQFAPVVVIIKLLSIVGACWLCFASCRLLQAVGAPASLGLLTLLLPSVILNTSLLGQADTFWAAPCLHSVAAAVKRQHLRVAAWAGLAFAVKAQAAWLAPFVAYYLAVERARPLSWVAAPVIYAAAMLPAWAAGWPLSYLMMIYPEQVLWRRDGDMTFVGNGANLWTSFGYFAAQAAYDLRWLAYLLTLVAIAFYMHLLPRWLTSRKILIAAAISALLVPFFLPLMHERFFLLADVLVFAYAIAYPSRRTIIAAAAMQVASAWPVLVWAYGLQPGEQFAPPLAAYVLVFLLYELRESRSEVSCGLAVSSPVKM